MNMQGEIEKEIGGKRMEINIDGWKMINEFNDCPNLNKKVLVIHANKIYVGELEKDGDTGYCWHIENESGIEWVNILDVDAWLDIFNYYCIRS